MSESRKRRWFLPETPDVLAMLGDQIDITAEGIGAFAAWAHGDAARADEVREAEHNADHARRTLVEAVRDAFTTPLEPEDLFELSRGIDEVLNAAKNTVREAEVMGVLPDQPMQEMADLAAEGVAALGTAFRALGSDAHTATEAASAAIKSQRRLERVYRLAMSDLMDESDLRAVIARQELYRRMSVMSDALVGVADRIWYSTVKEA